MLFYTCSLSYPIGPIIIIKFHAHNIIIFKLILIYVTQYIVLLYIFIVPYTMCIGGHWMPGLENQEW